MSIIRARSITLTLIGCSFAVWSGSVLAQSTQPDRKQAQEAKESGGSTGEKAGEKGILAGPKVQEESLDANRGFGEGDRARREITVPPQLWFRMLNELGLSEEQKSEMRVFVAAHEAATKAYRDEHATKIRELEQKVEAMRSGDAAPDRTIAQELQRIRNGAPKVDVVQEKVWAILTPDQQATMKERLAEARARLEERRRSAASDRANPERRDGMMENNEGMEAPPPDPQPGELRGPGLDEPGLRRLRFLRSLQRETDAAAETDRPRRRPTADRARSGDAG